MLRCEACPSRADQAGHRERLVEIPGPELRTRIRVQHRLIEVPQCEVVPQSSDGEVRDAVVLEVIEQPLIRVDQMSLTARGYSLPAAVQSENPNDRLIIFSVGRVSTGVPAHVHTNAPSALRTTSESVF